MSSPPQLSSEVMQILAQRARMRRILIALFSLLFVSAVGMTGWVIWKRGQGPDPGNKQPGGIRIVTNSAPATAQGVPEFAGRDTGAQGSGGSETDPGPASLFDLQPGLGVEPESQEPSTPESPGDEPLLKTEDVLEQLAAQRAMLEVDADSFDARGAALVVAEILNGILAAEVSADILPSLRHGEAMLPLLKAFEGRPEELRIPKQVEVRSAALVEVEDLAVLLIQLADRHFKEAAFIQDDESGKWLLDWESFVGFSTMSWDGLREQKPTTPVYVRAHSLLTDYHNYGFSDPEQYLALRLDSPDNFHAIYGYVDRKSPLAEEILQALADGRVRPALMQVRYPESATQDNQVIIDDVVAWRWLDVRDGPSGDFIGVDVNGAAPVESARGEEESEAAEAGPVIEEESVE